MSPPAGFPIKRIGLAITLSVLLHSLLLWKLPDVKIFANEELPRLQAKLEPLPKLATKRMPRIPKVQAAVPDTTLPLALPVPAPAPASAAAQSAVETAESGAASAIATGKTLDALNAAPADHPLLPKHAQLHFAVQYGSGNFKVGEVVHELENINGRYSLQAATVTTGLASLFKSYHLSQNSTGSVSNRGLRPESYTEIRTDSSGIQNASSRFDWDTHRVHFGNGKNANLDEQAQDILSLAYQLSQLPLNRASFPITLSNGKNIAQYYIVVGEEGTISTAMGELRTVSLHKVHGANEDGLIIWLALEYRLLPVKILYLDQSGEVSANLVITDIRVSDE